MHLLTQILSQENFESNGHLSRNLSKIGPSRTSGTCGPGGASRGKVATRKSPPLRAVWRRRAPPKAASHQGKAIPSPPQSDLRATNVTWQPHVWRPLGQGPQSTLSRPFRARRSAPERENPASAIAARSQAPSYKSLPRVDAPLLAQEAGGSERHVGDEAQDFLSKACIFRLWPGARWLRTWGPPIPTCSTPPESCSC